MFLALFGSPRLAWSEPERDTEQLRELVRAATEAYGRGELETSIRLLRQAYGLRADPRLLYNIARAEDGLGRYADAVSSYRAFLEKAPESAHAKLVVGRIKALEATIAQANRRAANEARLRAEREEARGNRRAAIHEFEVYLTLAPTAPDRAAIESRIRSLRTPQATTPDQPQSVGAGSSPWAWTTLGGGVAVAGTGGVLLLLADRKYAQAEKATTGTETASLRDSGDRFTTWGNVALVGGGLMAAGGAVWLLMGSTREPRASFVITPAAASLGCSF